MRTIRLVCVLGLLCGSIAARATEYHGTVKFGGLPLPGATVTATQGEKKFVTTSGLDGVYSFPNLSDGAWTIQVEMSLFAPVKQDVTIAAGVAAGAVDLKLMSMDEIHTQAKPVQLAAAAATTTAPTGVVLTGSTTASKSDTAKNKAAKPAQAGGTAPPPPPPVDDATQKKAADGFLINGSVNNAATSQYSQNQRFGNSVNNGRRLYNGNLYLVFDNSALNANSYSVTGTSPAKLDSGHITGNLTVGGPIKIPHLIRNGPNFTFTLIWSRLSTPSTQNGLVPTAAQRAGDLSQLKDASGNPVVVYNPATGQPYAGNIVPVSSQAKALLNLYPLPNVATTSTSRYNYQLPTVSSVHSDGFNLNLTKSVGSRDSFFGSVGANSTRTSTPQGIFGYGDKTNTFGINANPSWSHRFGQTFPLRNMQMRLSYSFSRSRSQSQPYFENLANISGNAGITGNNQSPENWGPPSLNFSSSGIYGLSDGVSSFNRNETNVGSINLQWNHGRQYITVLGDLQRREGNFFRQSNPRGTFSFTGAATQGPGSTGGSDLADFLIGVPDTSSLITGNPDKYLRQTVYDVAATDDWRLRPELTLNLGLRWEYSAPITETQNRLVNLDVAPNFTAVAPVLASNPKGSLTGQIYPNALMRPDRRSGIEPRVGFKWLPIPGSSLVVGGSYGITDDTSVYQWMAQTMAEQAPLSRSLNVQNSAACPLTLANGFINCNTSTAQTFGVDPNFRVGYAQTWQLTAQRDLPMALQMVASYTGIKGTHGPQRFLPNTYAVGAANPCPSCPLGFYYLASGGNSTHEEAHLQLRRRLRGGLTASVDYTFGKSLDNDSYMGGGGSLNSGTTVQNWRDLRAERGLSNFDQRHLVKAMIQYTTGMGLTGGALMSGWRGAIYREWTFVTNISAGSGLPQTPLYSQVLPGTAYTGVLRPNATGLSPNAAPAGYFVNPAAFAIPTAGQFGSARKNSITGPGQFSMDAQMARTFRIYKDRYSMDAQLRATNVLNHVVYSQWNTTVGNTLFGTPLNANSMRVVEAALRLRF